MPDVESLFFSVGGRPSRHYLRVHDLRPYGYSAILHHTCLHGKPADIGQQGPRGNHKLELIDTGMMSYAEMLDEIAYVFRTNAERLSIMRLDLAVDIEGIGVRWFAENTRVLRKQWHANLGVIATAQMGKNEPQTLYYGKRPNVIRIYDKVAELRAQFRRFLREIGASTAPPTFEDHFGFPDTGKILTRVERQMGGGRIPAALGTVGQLIDCAEFNPFESIEFVGGGCPEPNAASYSFMDYCTGMYLRHLCQSEGMQSMLAFVTRNSKRNRGWAMKKFADFLPVANEFSFTEERLFHLYKQSIERQFAGQNSLANFVIPARMDHHFSEVKQ
jgi:hypothetical protein